MKSLAEVSGIATYTARVTLSQAWTGGYGAYLQLKHSDDMVTGVTVNGQAVSGIDQSQDMSDVGRYLKAGVNTIQVRLVTTLVNRVKVANPTFVESMRPMSFPGPGAGPGVGAFGPGESDEEDENPPHSPSGPPGRRDRNWNDQKYGLTQVTLIPYGEAKLEG